MKRLDNVLPKYWSPGNPLDIFGDATYQRYRIAVETCLHDTNMDGVLVMLTPQAITKPLQVPKAIIETSVDASKSVLASWMGEQSVEDARELLAKHKITVFYNPESSIEAFA